MWLHVFNINEQLVVVSEYSWGAAESTYKNEFKGAKIVTFSYLGMAKYGN
ncbi:MAG: hypothetical protein WA118_08190 [Carboxydocellales bacterium]